MYLVLRKPTKSESAPLSLPASRSRHDDDDSLSEASDVVHAFRDKPCPVRRVRRVGRSGEPGGGVRAVDGRGDGKRAKNQSAM